MIAWSWEAMGIIQVGLKRFAGWDEKLRAERFLLGGGC